MWNWDLGYCQGMSDMAAPLLWVVACSVLPEFNKTHDPSSFTDIQLEEVEAEAFWLFASLMEKIGMNFSSDEHNRMAEQLESLRNLVEAIEPPLYDFLRRKESLNMFFCFRWILILFKREFKFDAVLRLWDAFFSQPNDNLHLFVALSILIEHKTSIMDLDLHFDGLLEYCISLAGQIDLERTLSVAESLQKYAKESGLI